MCCAYMRINVEVEVDHFSCLVKSNKQQTKEVRSKAQPENSDQRELQDGFGFVLWIAPLSLSGDRDSK